VIDFDAMWGSDKLAACADWAQAEYAWLYGLADASGCFEMTNLRVIWGRVAAVRGNFTIERLEQVFLEFQDKGLLFVWEHEGKRYAHWTGSDVPGRLPPPSWRMRLEKFAPPVPKAQLAEYMGRFARGRAVLARAAFRGEGADAAGAERGNLQFDVANFKDGRGTNHGQLQQSFARGDVGSADQVSCESGAALPAGRWRENCEVSGSRKIWHNGRLEDAQAQDLGLGSDLKMYKERELEPGGSGGERGQIENLRSESNSMANSNFHRNANANANSNADTNANSNANSNTLTGLNANALRNLESQINSRMRSEEPAHASEECNSHTEANCNSSQDPRFQSPKGETRFAAAYRMSVREMAVERELRVGAGPVCGPGRIRPEVLERIRLREEKWARERAAAGGRAP
jgi:hypothetical protein